jgi:ADP-ribose pyrophosphatase YjhB (NUDIX family)
VRVAAKAVIMKGDALLVVEYEDDKGPWYILPGGKVEPGETLTQALRRECIEELETEVEVGDVWFIREYIADNHEFFAEWTAGVHHLDLVFRCELVDPNYDPALVRPTGRLEKSAQWIELARLRTLRFHPPQLLDSLSAAPPRLVYLGDVR